MHLQVAATPSLCDVIDAISFCCFYKGMADAVVADAIHTAADIAIIVTHITKSIPNIRPEIHR